MELRRLNLIFPPTLEDAVVAALLDRTPALPGFTTLRAEGHGSDFARASVREQVRGHVARRVLWMVLPREEVETVLAELRQRLPSREITWWTEIVEGFGRLA
ncbi:MAG: DUF3240 domain-containing protein [Rhodanobacteraceae bacterium]|jgi:hypothetical protein|nr:DUF3240 domain-containing protein [Rhodanobacteraceae bacterium]